MINRRQFLYLAGAGATNLLNVNGWPFAKAGLASSKVPIFPGEPTMVWRYNSN